MSDTTSKSSVTIKKYANRRLYNTATSTYVTLEDLSAMVKEGTEFNVYDAKTSEDITRSVLTQIIVEEESKSGQQNLLPIGFLRQLIGFYGDSLQWMVPKYLEQSMEALTGNHGRIQEYFQNTLGTMGGVFPFGITLEEMSKQNMAVFERTMTMFSPFSLNLANPLFTTDNTTSSDATPTQTTTATTTTTEPTTNRTAPTTESVTTTTAACPIKPQTSATTDTTDHTATTTKVEESPKTASITNLKPRNENPAPKAAPMPMPNVQATTSGTGTDDMQQKIANLQRQLADLAKSRA